MHLTSMNRYQAFAIHFGISMMIFLLVLAIAVTGLLMSWLGRGARDDG